MTIGPGERRVFWSTSIGALDSRGDPVYLHGGQTVQVIGRLPDSGMDEEEAGTLYIVELDGVEWEAFEGELDGTFHQAGEYYGPSGTWGKDN